MGTTVLWRGTANLPEKVVLFLTVRSKSLFICLFSNTLQICVIHTLLNNCTFPYYEYFYPILLNH